PHTIPSSVFIHPLNPSQLLLHPINVDARLLLSSPTRRSSDLRAATGGRSPPPAPPPCRARSPPACGRWCRRTRAATRCAGWSRGDRKSTRLNSSHVKKSYAVLCLEIKKSIQTITAIVSHHQFV